MQGDIVAAAKWFGGSMVAAAFIVAVGFHPGVTGRTVAFPRTGDQPLCPNGSCLPLPPQSTVSYAPSSIETPAPTMPVCETPSR